MTFHPANATRNSTMFLVSSSNPEDRVFFTTGTLIFSSAIVVLDLLRKERQRGGFGK
jgi:hypothetical protein